MAFSRLSKNEMNTNIKAIERQHHWPISKTNESGSSGFETFMIINYTKKYTYEIKFNTFAVVFYSMFYSGYLACTIRWISVKPKIAF